jgi:O-succinylbenzoic acid--CoA ligase
MRVLRETDGKEAAANEEGMLQLHDPVMFNKYDGDPEATADGWFITGDSTYLDEHGQLLHH